MVSSGYEAHLEGINKGIQADIKQEEEVSSKCYECSFVKHDWEFEHDGIRYCNGHMKEYFADSIETLMYDRLGSCLLRHEIIEIQADACCEPEFVIVKATLTGEMIIERFKVPVNQL